MPATDIINLVRNEKDSTRDFSLAYIGMHPMNILLCTITDGIHYQPLVTFATLFVR